VWIACTPAARPSLLPLTRERFQEVEAPVAAAMPRSYRAAPASLVVLLFFYRARLPSMDTILTVMASPESPGGSVARSRDLSEVDSLDSGEADPGWWTRLPTPLSGHGLPHSLPRD
jgi:hypothetical protein